MTNKLTIGGYQVSSFSGLTVNQELALAAALSSLPDLSWAENLRNQIEAALLATGASPWADAVVASTMKSVLDPWTPVYALET